MRICIHTPTGKILEMQSAATEGTLTQNAINAGFSVSDIEEREVDDAEYSSLRNAQEPPRDQSDIDLAEKHIKALAIVVAKWSGKTMPQLKDAFRAAADSLP